MSANFLLYPDSFMNVVSPEGQKQLRILDEAISHARNKGDIIFGNSVFISMQLPNSFNFLTLVNEDFRKTGLARDAQNILRRILFRKTPQSTTFIAFNQEFPNASNGMMGLSVVPLPCQPDQYVTNIPEWEIFHSVWDEFYANFFRNNNQLINWEADEYFPNLQYSNKILIEEAIKLIERKLGKILTKEEKEKITVQDFEREARMLNGQQLRPIATEIGKIIAERNYYTYDDEISRAEFQEIHQERHIYSIKKGNRYQYLSIDFSSAAFEVCDHNGNQIGEWLFSGTKNDQYRVNDHSLQSLKRGRVKR